MQMNAKAEVGEAKAGGFPRPHRQAAVGFPTAASKTGSLLLAPVSLSADSEDRDGSVS